MDSLPRLPQEILDIIIDDDSHGTLTHQVLALVSKSFLLRSRRHLFSYISFHGEEVRALQARFWEVLHANPYIASYVREVCIHDSDSVTVSGDTMFEDAGERPSWIREEVTLQWILLALAKNQVTHLTFDANLDWTTLPTGLQHALTQILIAPSLVNIELFDVKNLPVSCCTQFQRLYCLRISGVVLVESEDHYRREVAAMSISSLFVTSLKGRSAHLFRNMLGLGTGDTPLSSLKTLGMSFCDAGLMRDVLWATRKSLRYLTLAIRRDPEAINLSEFESLNHLELKVHMHEYFETGILRVLETGGVPSNKELRSIRINLHQYSYRCWLSYLSYENAGSFWRRLATLLNRFSDVVDLVTIHLSMFRGNSDRGDLGEEQRTALESMVRKGLLSDEESFATVNKVLVLEISVL